MRLIELNPFWIEFPFWFAFHCPHCRKVWLTCKTVPISMRRQFDAFSHLWGECKWNAFVVPMREDTRWTFSSSDFASISVSPSIDASASGHWHGFITNGEIR